MKGFIPYKYPDGQPTPFEYMTVGDGTYKVGDALGFTGGVLELITGGTTAPEYLSMFDGTLAANAVKPVIKVDKDVVYESELSENSAGIAAGAKYTLAASGDSVTATTAGGVAEVIGYSGKGVGDTVYVRF